MPIIIILLLVIVLLLGGWWIFAVGIGLLLAAIGAVIAAVAWLVRTLWPFLWPTLVVGFIGFTVLAVIGLILEAKGVIKRRPKIKPPTYEDRPLPPISRTWAERKTEDKRR